MNGLMSDYNLPVGGRAGRPRDASEAVLRLCAAYGCDASNNLTGSQSEPNRKIDPRVRVGVV